jgi:hypothetical protein
MSAVNVGAHACTWACSCMCYVNKTPHCFKLHAVAKPHAHCCRLEHHSCTHVLEDCALRRLDPVPLQLTAVQPGSMREHQHQQHQQQQQQGRNALQQRNRSTQSDLTQPRPISSLRIQQQAGEQVCISIRSACSTATNVAIHFRPVMTADQPQGAGRQTALATQLHPRHTAAVRSIARSGGARLRRRLQQQAQQGTEPTKPPWAHKPEVCCCPPSSGGNATTVLTKKAHVPPDGHCCCGTFKWAKCRQSAVYNHPVVHLCKWHSTDARCSTLRTRRAILRVEDPLLKAASSGAMEQAPNQWSMPCAAVNAAHKPPATTGRAPATWTAGPAAAAGTTASSSWLSSCQWRWPWWPSS